MWRLVYLPRLQVLDRIALQTMQTATYISSGSVLFVAPRRWQASPWSSPLRLPRSVSPTICGFSLLGSCPSSAWRHYALALDHYTHFTSPIRRYADVIVHRQLAAFLSGHLPDRGFYLAPEEVAAIAKRCNAQKKNATTAQDDCDAVWSAFFNQPRLCGAWLFGTPSALRPVRCRCRSAVALPTLPF
jgi:hypothetical protein